MVVRLRAYQGMVFAFCAGALIAGALLEVVPEAMALLSSTHVYAPSAGSVWFEPHHVLVSCVAGFLCFYVVEHLTHQRETTISRLPVPQAGSMTFKRASSSMFDQSANSSVSASRASSSAETLWV